jgi:hypothetical protein
LAVGLTRHVWQRIQAVFRFQFDLVDRLVALVPALLPEHAVAADISVRRTVEFSRVGFQGMGGELLDIDLGRRGEALGPQRIVPQRRPVHVGEGRQSMLFTRLVRRDKRRGVLDGRRRTRQMGNSCFLGGISGVHFHSPVAPIWRLWR